MIEIIFRRKAAGHDLSDPAVRPDGQLALLQNQCLDPRFQRVVQLEALGREHFDAVVLIRIVRGRNNDARVRMQIDRQKRHRRRRDHTQHDRVAAAGRQPRDQRALQHVGGNARILADHDGRLRAGIIRKRNRRRLADPVGKLCIQRLVCHAADAVSPK